jgi:3-hydroxyacyl-[acyl-carrier-protein] dehydratase
VPAPIASLPHHYPFRFVERVVVEKDAEFSRGRVRLGVTAGGWATSGESWGSPLLLAEAIAQSALLLQGGDAEIGKRGFLAGIDGFEALRAPRVGEILSIDVRLAARFGSMVRFEGTVSDGGEIIARGQILVRHGSLPEMR